MADNTEHQENESAAKAPKNGKKAEADADAHNENFNDDGGEYSEGEGFSDPLEFLNAELERVEAEKADTQNQLMRMAAEMENLRKRTQKDVADARNYSIASFAREMLAVDDNLGRALQAVPEDVRREADDSLRSLIEGVELTHKSMQQALERNGVKRISPLNEKFDPNFHQAMFEIPNTEVASNTVLQVVQDGYVIGDRVLRPAMVGVSKGGPKQAAAKDNADDGEGAAEQPDEAQSEARGEGK